MKIKSISIIKSLKCLDNITFNLMLKLIFFYISVPIFLNPYFL